ncbi:MAG: hypothetical protein ACK5MJ_04730 [Alphaproteobacteria bacterium]
MKKFATIILLGSTLALSACNSKEKEAQAKIDEAQNMLAQATQMLKETQETQVTQAAEQTPAATSEAQTTTPAYKDWVSNCVRLRNDSENKCASLETGAKQSACLLSASRDMGLCMADKGAESLQDTVISQGTELGTILGETAKSLDGWLKKNETSLDGVANAIAPFMDQLNQPNSGDAGQKIQNLLQSLGDAIDKAVNDKMPQSDTPPNPQEPKAPESDTAKKPIT